MVRKIVFSALAVFGGLGLVTAIGYNALQQQEEQVFQAWADLDASLKRRNDLIPNLVSVTKSYAKHEKETFQAVVDARAKASEYTLSKEQLSDPEAIAKFFESQAELKSSLTKLLAVVEAYPELKASENFKDLQHQLEGTENRINYARQQVNESTQTFNTSIRTFPGSWINRTFCGLEKKAFFKAEPAETQPVIVEMDE